MQMHQQMHRRDQDDTEMPVCAFVPGWVLSDTRLSPGAKLAFATFGTVYDASNATEKISLQGIAKQMGVSVQKVRRYIRELQNAKVVGKSKHLSLEDMLERSMYQITSDAPDDFKLMTA